MINLRVTNLEELMNCYVEYVWLEYDSHEFLGESKTPWVLVDEWTRKKLGTGFYDILIADSSQLSVLAQKIDQDVSHSFPYFILDIVKTYDHFSNKNRGIGCSKNKMRITAYDLLEHMNIKSCPYCNKSEINIIREGQNRCSELDHFFNKNDYPVFALSFHNLIPSCHPCNNRKRLNKIGASPYDKNDISSLSEFGYSGDFMNAGSLKIEYWTTGGMSRNEEIFNIKSNYENNVDELSKLLRNIEDCPIDALKKLYQESAVGYSSLIEAAETRFDCVWNEELFFKKHISKFKKDILKKKYDLDE